MRLHIFFSPHSAGIFHEEWAMFVHPVIFEFFTRHIWVPCNTHNE